MKKYLRSLIDIYKWRKRGLMGQSPQFVKQMILKENSVNGDWIETGTFRGTTTRFLSTLTTGNVHSVEPFGENYNFALQALSDFKNIHLYNQSSEECLGQLIDKCSDRVNFWLDGHFSGEGTFEGQSHCPVITELSLIKERLHKLSEVVIFIDDARCFDPRQSRYQDYPSRSAIVKWCDENKFSWEIVHDIFILSKRSQ